MRCHLKIVYEKDFWPKRQVQLKMFRQKPFLVKGIGQMLFKSFPTPLNLPYPWSSLLFFRKINIGYIEQWCIVAWEVATSIWQQFTASGNSFVKGTNKCIFNTADCTCAYKPIVNNFTLLTLCTIYKYNN